jgi:hypothetical protein
MDEGAWIKKIKMDEKTNPCMVFLLGMVYLSLHDRSSLLIRVLIFLKLILCQ